LSVIQADGTGAHTIVEENTGIRSPRWSSNGDAVYYLRGARSAGFELWKAPVSPDTGLPAAPPSRVVAGLPFGTAFTLTGDGKAMAYARAVRYRNLWLVTLPDNDKRNQTESTQLTTGTFSDSSPAISPDRSRVAFSRRTGDKSDVYLVPVGGGPPQQLTFLGNADSPVWSPDGNNVAFISASGGTFRIWRVASAGGSPRVFAKTEAAAPNEGGAGPLLAWAPAPTILYQRPGNRTFHTLDPATESESAAVSESTGWIFSPKYSADGRQLAAYWNRLSSGPGVWIVSTALGERQVHVGFALPAGWSPDGKFVYIVEAATPARLIAVSSTGGSPRVLTELPWPFDFDDNLTCTTSDGRRFVCAVPQSTSDAWIVRNFDPEER
jgi:Tol biopolymer transport system component